MRMMIHLFTWPSATGLTHRSPRSDRFCNEISDGTFGIKDLSSFLQYEAFSVREAGPGARDPKYPGTPFFSGLVGARRSDAAVRQQRAALSRSLPRSRLDE